jgi:pimeloyl-ACP methyl ester carboxylesterase
MTEGYVEVPNGRLYVEAIGAGDPLVLIHAGIADSRQWDDQLAPFSERYHVIRYDIRGYGRSTDPDGDFAHHDDLLAVLHHVGAETANLVGVSLAGSIIIDFALAFPGRVLSLIPVATCPNGYDRWGDEIRSGWAAENAAMEAKDFARATEICLEMWVDGPQRSAGDVDPVVRQRAREMIDLNEPREGSGEELWLEPEAVGRLGEISVPTMVIVGDKDQPDMIEASRLIAREIPGATIESMPGVAHLPNMERPDEFNRLVLDFLASVPGT